MMFPIFCNALCKARAYGVMPHVRHLYVLLPLVTPIVKHVYLGSTQSKIAHRELTHQLLYTL